MKNLTEEDKIEIFYALETKIIDIKRGTYGPTVEGDVNLDQWVKQLERIQKKLSIKGTKTNGI